MKNVFIFILIVICAQAKADHRLAVEYKATFPVGSDDQSLANGFQIQYENTLYDFLDYYLAWNMSRFEQQVDNSKDYDIEKSGYALGISVERLFFTSTIGGYIGLTYKHYEHSADVIGDSKYDYGYEFGALFKTPVTSRWDVYGRAGYEESSRNMKVNSCCSIEIDDQLVTSLGLILNF